MALINMALSRRALAFALALLPWRAWGQATLYRIPPSETDPGITRFNQEDNWVFYQPTSPSAQLLLYLPGSEPTEHGIPFERFQDFFRTATAAGYNVIALQYNDHPAVDQLCPRNPDPDCSGRMREKRAFGSDVTQVIDDTPAESIVARLTGLLNYLVKHYPNQNWARYLAGGTPNWSEIVVCGHSQGAGMAAYIAKRVPVARVALLSGPWDYAMPGQVPAPWLSTPPATPPSRWFALFHVEERHAEALQRAYAALAVPPNHIRALQQPAMAPGGGRMDVFHVSVVNDRLTPRAPDGSPAYRGDWAFLLGHAS